jgi:exosortase
MTSQASSRIQQPNSTTRLPRWKWGVIGLPLAWFWFRLIDNLQVDWRTNPQYSYGLLVPFLCMGLLIFRWHAVRTAVRQTTGQQNHGTTEQPGKVAAHFTGQGHNETTGQQTGDREQKSVVGGQRSVVFLFAFLAFLYLPTRLLEAAVPEWNPIQWLLGIETVGLTLCVIRLGLGRGWLTQLAFPICFFLVAVPWPTLVEQPIIQTLTRVSAAIVVDLLGVAGVPALTHGNVIEVSTGMVGIDEACSGIRSFQSSLMISLFFGEFYRLSQGRRWLLVPLGFLFSMAFNIGRMTFLTWIAADKGINAISEFHDPAGITIAILCTLALWGLAAGLKGPRTADHETASGSPVVSSPVVPWSRRPWSVVRGLSITLLVWLVAVEAGVQLWYHHLDSHLKSAPEWTLTFPRTNPTFRALPIDEKTRYLLQFDNGKQGSWTAANGTQWQAFYFNWLPGRVAGYLAKRHTPEICLTAEGLKMLSGPKLTMMKIHGVVLPMRCYVFQTAQGVAQVFQCRWDAGAQADSYVAHESARYNLIRAVWAGRGDQGQKVLEFVISGMDDPGRAEQALVRELDKLIKVQRSEDGSRRTADRGQRSGAGSESRK